ncbi:MAG: ribosomal protein S18-alanine N-acetyltransferase [Candidatus Bathyarchaeia archaeon]
MVRDIRIRRGRIRDLGAVCEIERLSFSHPYTPTLLRDLLLSSPDSFFVAVSNSDVIGYIAGRLVKRHGGHIVTLAVHPMFRGRGVGEKLTERLIQHFRARKAGKAQLEVRISNVMAQELYLKLGFIRHRIIPSYYPDGEDAVVMVANL